MGNEAETLRLGDALQRRWLVPPNPLAGLERITMPTFSAALMALLRREWLAVMSVVAAVLLGMCALLFGNRRGARP